LKQILKKLLLGLLGAAAVVYGFDWAAVTFRIPAARELYADIRVDQVYTSTNKYKELEYSRGNPVTERCVYALFPHEGFRPCWYVTRHTMNVTNTD
jgi:hypothetical protein